MLKFINMNANQKKFYSSGVSGKSSSNTTDNNNNNDNRDDSIILNNNYRDYLNVEFKNDVAVMLSANTKKMHNHLIDILVSIGFKIGEGEYKFDFYYNGYSIDKILLLYYVGESRYIKSIGNNGFIKVLSIQCTVNNKNYGSNLVEISKKLAKNLSKRNKEGVKIGYDTDILLVITKITSESNIPKNTQKGSVHLRKNSRDESAAAVLRDAAKIGINSSTWLNSKGVGPAPAPVKKI